MAMAWGSVRRVTTKTELVRSIGADYAIDYTQEDCTGGRQQYDLILDIAGHRSMERS